MECIVTEARLEPPGKHVLVQAETARTQELVCRLGRVEERIFLLEPFTLRKETENQGKLVLASLRRKFRGCGIVVSGNSCGSISKLCAKSVKP